jgi:hypothetical protein
MKQIFTILSVMAFVILMSYPIYGQEDFVGEGYAKILELNKFDSAPHYPIVADEVHAGFDLDKDGKLEFIFLADHSLPNGPAGGWTDGHSVYVYEWSGSAFELMWTWANDPADSTGGASYPTMAVADLDGDTNQEIVFGMPHGTNKPGADVSPRVIHIFEFTTEGGPTQPTASWTAHAAPGTNTRPAGMAAGDIDGDGEDEVIVAFRSYSTAVANDALLIFSLDGPFAGDFTQFKTEVLDTLGDHGSIYSADITDIDNDGNLEAYFPAYSGGGVSIWYEATGTDTYMKYTLDGVAEGTIQAAFEADVDGDEKNEIVWGGTSGNLYLIHGVTDLAEIDSVNETRIAEVEPGGCRGLTVGDYNGDGNADIFMAGNWEGSLWRIAYDGEGDITDSASYSYELVFQDTTLGPRAYAASFPGDNIALKQGGSASTDMNGNGEPEVLIAFAAAGDSLQNWIVMIEGNGITSIEIEPGQKILKTYTLRQNYPNPFNPTTTISYQIPVAEKVSLKIYDMLGREVRTLVNGDVDAGSHTVVWNGTNNSGVKVASGVYIYKLKAGKHQLNKKMTFMK